MPTAIVTRSQIEQLNAYPMVITGQIVADTASSGSRPATHKSGTPAHLPQRPLFARLHHTSKFGRPR